MTEENIKGICFRKRNDNMFDYLSKNRGLCIVYGAGNWGRGVKKEGHLKIDYFCDRRADELQVIEGIPVVDCAKLENLIKESGRRATIIICVGLRSGMVIDIYSELIKFNVNADVFDYFENANIFKDKFFEFDGKEYVLYEHSYNCGYTNTRMTERSVELALAEEYLHNCKNDVIEVGAVTPYYFFDKKIIEIVDPTDLHERVNARKSLFECDFEGKNVLSISTIEHVGTHDYGMNEEKNVIDALTKITSEAASCLITAPLGYNVLLDNWIKDNKSNPMIKIMKRGMNNHWAEVDLLDDEDIIYGPLWANGLVVIRK